MKIVGIGVVLPSLGRLKDELRSWLKETRASLDPRVEAVSLHGLEARIQGLQGAKSQLG